jgi:hypothetical protein
MAVFFDYPNEPGTKPPGRTRAMSFMKSRIVAGVVLASGLCTASGAQDLVVTNARILDGGGGPAWLDEQAPAAMQAWLDAGFTTLLDALAVGPTMDQYAELRRRIDAGEIAGPRRMCIDA